MIRFGTAGFPLSTPKNGGAIEALSRVRSLGLDGMELEFVRGVWLNPEKGKAIAAASTGLFLSAHAPYYVNLNSPDPAVVGASQKRIVAAAAAAASAGAIAVVFHPGFFMKTPGKEALSAVTDRLKELHAVLTEQGICINLAPETTGKPSQIGSLDEILSLCLLVPGCRPCIDFSHLFARSNGQFNSKEDFSSALDKIAFSLGAEALTRLHMHVSGIDYTAKGEKKHILLSETKFNWQGLLAVLKERNCSGTLICESPNLEEDALRLKDYYHSL
ncbi:MAG: TIM barrel protein [Candidatus Wallbacteria bacterium]|nr:TIM barrel protein [Candidatus Wallbacteria bacterium]